MFNLQKIRILLQTNCQLLLFLIFIVSSASADIAACLLANKQIAANAVEICSKTLNSPNVTVDDKSKIYIIQASYFITKNEFIAANKSLDKAFNINQKMLKNGTYRFNWLRTKGKLYFAKEDYLKALPFFKNAMEVALIINKSKIIAMSYNDLGANYIELNNFTEALNWVNKSLEIHQRNNNKALSAVSLANIAEIYFITNETTKSLEYFNKSIVLLKQLLLTPKGQVDGRERSLAKIHISVAKLHMVNNHWDEAFHKLQQALSIYKKYNLKGEQVKVLSSIGEMFLKQSKIDNAMDFLLQAQEIESSLETQDNLDFKQVLLDAFIVNQDWIKAKKLAFKSLQQAIDKDNKASEAGFLLSLSSLFEKTNEEKKAIAYLKKHYALNKELLDDRYNESKIKLLENSGKQENLRALNILEKQKSTQEILIKRQQLYFTALAFVLLFLVGFLLFRLKEKKKVTAHIKRDQSVNTQELSRLSISESSIKRLFKGMDCLIVCFDSTGKIHYDSTLHKKDNSLKMQTSYTNIWQLTLSDFNEDEQLEKDLYLDKNQVDNYEMVWIHQLKYLDNMLVCLIMNPNCDNRNYTAFIENIRNYSQLKQKMWDIEAYMQTMFFNEMPKLTPVLMATKSLRLDEKAPSNSILPEKDFKRQLVDLMVLCLDIWQNNTSKSAIDLAEKSGLWLVSVESGHLRTRTLNRYLDIKKIPKNPRWLQVVKTAHFVLSHCNVNISQRQSINEKITQIKNVSRNRALGL